MEQEKCKVCGGNKKSKESETCSRECANTLKRERTYEERLCKNCGSKFEERKKKKRSFCSDECRIAWQKKPENIEKRIEKSKKAVLDKHGVEFSFQIDEVQKKAIKSSQETRDAIGEDFIKKIKETKKQRYGDENFNNLEQLKKTKAKRYGDENFNNREKAQETMTKRYGVSHAMKKQEFQEKASITSLEKYGVNHPMKNEDVFNKQRQTNLDKYGVENYAMTKEFKDKVSNTWIKKLGETKQYQLIKTLEENSIELIGNFSGFTHPSHVGERYIEYSFRCTSCGHEFSRKFCNPTIPICRRCFPSPKSPKTHEDIRIMLNESGISFLENSRKHLDNLELDFVVEDRGVAIEIDGNYFHSERGGEKDKNYHLSKTVEAHNKGFRLIHIFEDEIINKKEIVLSRVASILGKQKKSIGARKCFVKELTFDEKRRFFNENHIQGDSPSKYNYGLIYQGEILSAISLGSKRKSLGSNTKKDSYELIRFCVKNNAGVSGAFSRLFSFFIKQYDPQEVLTFADIRWSGYDPEKTVYSKNGFEFDGFTKPNYWYFKKNNYLTRYHRFSFRKDKVSKQALKSGLINEGDEKKFTEWELAQMMGMDRIWDCGNMRFIWKK